MNRIEIPGLARVVARQNRYLRAHGYADNDRDISHPVIDGLALAYSKPIIFDDELQVFMPGCFAKSLASGKRIKLLIDHDETVEMTDTSAGLHIEEAADGLVFRVDLERTRNPNALLGMVESENRRCVSIGHKPVKSEIHKVAGHDVRFHTESELVEVSLVRAGKSAPAFAYVTDERIPSPTANGRSLDFSLAHATYRVQKAGAKAVAAMDECNAALNKRLDKLYEQYGLPKPDERGKDLTQACRDLSGTLDRLHKSLSSIKV